MRRDNKSSIIQLPVHLTLTDEGEYFFNQRHRTTEYMQGHAQVDPGSLVLQTYSAKTLQRLVFAGYISRLEVSRSDFTSKRTEIMDLAKLIAYGVLFKEYSVKLAKALKEVPMVVQWNRKNPSRALNTQSIIQNKKNAEQVQQFEKVRSVFTQVVGEIFGLHSSEVDILSQEEQELLRFKVENFLEQLNPVFWALLARESGSSNFVNTIRAFEDVVWSYLAKTNIADYLSLLVLELATLSEKSLMEKAVDTYLKGKVDLDHFMKNKKDRLKVLETMEAHNEKATISWRIQGRHGTVTETNPFQIIFFNRSVKTDSVRREIEDKKHLETQGKDLSEFYSELPGEQEDELGMYYLTYLQEECRRQGTLFDSYVNHIEQHDLSFITLAMRF
jgi:hypothetical protein